MKKMSLLFLCLCFLTSETVFAAPDIHPTVNAVSQASDQNGIKFYTVKGNEVSFKKWASSQSRSSGLIAALPANLLNLKAPLVVTIKYLSTNSQYMTMQLGLYDQNFSRQYISEILNYDFNKSDQANEQLISSQISRAVSHLPSGLFASSTPGKASFSEKVAQLFIPKAQAQYVDQSRPKVIGAIVGLILSAGAIHGYATALKWVPTTLAKLPILGATVLMGNLGALLLFCAFSHKCTMSARLGSSQ